MKSKSKEIKLTGTSYALMAVLHEFGEMTSYDIKQAMESSIQNFWPVPHTTAYEEPARLAAAGYLAAKQEEGGRRRRIYALTDKGREALAAWAAEPSAAPPQLREEAMLKVFAGGNPAGLVASRLAWHRAKLEELQGYLALVRGNEGFEGSERTLVAGIAYEEKMLELLEPFGEAAGTS
jgi:DNA-binding PadR family transcriptional regulator